MKGPECSKESCSGFSRRSQQFSVCSQNSKAYPAFVIDRVEKSNQRTYVVLKVVKERPVFRPASPPAIPAWGGVNTGKSSAQEAPKPNEFPSLSTTSSGPLPSKPSRPTSTTSTEGDSVAKPNTFERWATLYQWLQTYFPQGHVIAHCGSVIAWSGNHWSSSRW